jgi:hypothetical protein
MIENGAEMQNGQVRGIRWTWATKGSDLRNGYMTMDGRISLAELIQLMGDVAPGSGFGDIHLNWATVTWQRVATPEELEERAEFDRSQAARREAWEHDMYKKLRAKFEGGSHDRKRHGEDA